MRKRISHRKLAAGAGFLFISRRSLVKETVNVVVIQRPIRCRLPSGRSSVEQHPRRPQRETNELQYALSVYGQTVWQSVAALVPRSRREYIPTRWALIESEDKTVTEDLLRATTAVHSGNSNVGQPPWPLYQTPPRRFVLQIWCDAQLHQQVMRANLSAYASHSTRLPMSRTAMFLHWVNYTHSDFSRSTMCVSLNGVVMLYWTLFCRSRAR